jgi:hypothetical protein
VNHRLVRYSATVHTFNAEPECVPCCVSKNQTRILHEVPTFRHGFGPMRATREENLSERSSLKGGSRVQTVVKSVWDQAWEPIYREILVRNGKVGEEARTELVTLLMNPFDLRLVVASSKG